MRTLCARYLRQRRNRYAAKRRNNFEVGFVACFFCAAARFFYGFDRNKKRLRYCPFFLRTGCSLLLCTSAISSARFCPRRSTQKRREVEFESESFYACFLVISKKEATVPLIAASRKKTAPVITVLPVEIAFGKISNSSLEKNVQPRPVKEP